MERPEKIVQPAGVELPGRVYLEIGKRRFDACFPDFKIFILVELDLLARAVGVLIEDIRPEARDIAIYGTEAMVGMRVPSQRSTRYLRFPADPVNVPPQVLEMMALKKDFGSIRACPSSLTISLGIPEA